MKIFKYPIEGSSFDLEMPQGAKILTAQVQGENPQLWVLVDPEAANSIRSFRVYGTGHEIDGRDVNNLNYIATFQQHEGALVWHLFEVKKA